MYNILNKLKHLNQYKYNMITCNLTCHVLLRLFIPMIIGMTAIMLISIIPICVQNNNLANVISEQMSTIGKIGTDNKINNLAIQLTDLLKQIDNDILLLHNYSTVCINGNIPIKQYYESYDGTTKTKIPPSDKDNYSYASAIYNPTAKIKYVNDTSIIDNIFRSIYKSNNNLYMNIFVGLDTGLTRVYPYISLSELKTNGYDPRAMAWYSKAMSNNNINYNSPEINEFNLKTSIAVCKSIEINGTKVGVVGLNYDISNIDNIIQNSSIIKSGYSFIFSYNGDIISYPSARNKVNTNIYTAETYITKNLLSNIFSNTPYILPIKKDDGTQWIVTFTNISSNYILATLYPESSLYIESTALNNSIYWAIIIGVIVVSILFGLICLILLIANIIVARRYAGNIGKLAKYILNITGVDDFDVNNIVVNSSELNKLKYNLGELRTVICYGNNAFHEGHLDKALQNYKSALVIFERTKNIKGLAMCYNNIANVHKQMKQTNDALDLYNKSISYVEQIMKSCTDDVLKTMDCKIMLANRYMNIGVLYKDNNIFEEASNYFTKSMDYNRQTDNISGIAKVNNNYGQLLLQKGLINEAEEHITDVYNIISKREGVDIISLQYSMMSMGILEFYKKNYNGCALWLSKILDTFKETNVYIQQTCLEYMDNSFSSMDKPNISAEIKKLKKKNTFSKNIFFVLDSSGSMDGSPIAQCKKSIKNIVDVNLSENDNVSLVTFNTTVKEVFPFRNKNTYIREIHRDIDNNINVGGMTSFYDALDYSISKIGGIGDNWIVALTDGEDNSSKINDKYLIKKISSMSLNIIIITVGSIKTEKTIKQICESCNKKGKGIFIKSLTNNSQDISKAFENVACILSGQLNVDDFR